MPSLRNEHGKGMSLILFPLSRTHTNLGLADHTPIQHHTGTKQQTSVRVLWTCERERTTEAFPRVVPEAVPGSTLGDLCYSWARFSRTKGKFSAGELCSSHLLSVSRLHPVPIHPGKTEN